MFIVVVVLGATLAHVCVLSVCVGVSLTSIFSGAARFGSCVLSSVDVLVVLLSALH